MYSIYQRLYIPKVIKFLLMLIVLSTAVTAIAGPLLPPSLNPLFWLSLSSYGVVKGFLWQIITFPFIEPIRSAGDIIHLFFSLYLLYTIGLSLIHATSEGELKKLIIGSVVFTGIITSLTLYFFPYPSLLSGPTSILYTMLTAWILLYPDAELYLFLTFPVKARWLFFIFAGVGMYGDITSENIARFAGYISAIAFGYFYGIITWKVHSPFTFLYDFEERLHSLTRVYSRKKVSVTAFSKDAKIFDFRTGKALLREDQFLDACLEKIKRYGRSSLSLIERFKLWNIARKKRSS